MLVKYLSQEALQENFESKKSRRPSLKKKEEITSDMKLNTLRPPSGGGIKIELTTATGG